MFFGKKRATKALPVEVPWDNRTRDFLTEADDLNVEITSVTKRSGFGRMREEEDLREPNGYEITGVMTYPKLLLVSVSLHQTLSPRGEFGGWFYNLYNHPVGMKESKFPLLEVWITDIGLKIGEAIYEAHRTAVLSGRRSSNVRFWKRPGEGEMSPKDQEKGWSYEGRYEVLGLYVWSAAQSKALPAWARPYGSEGFSLEKMPEWVDLRL